MAINNWLSDNSTALLAASAGLLGGRTANEQASMGISGFGAAMADRKAKNKTMEFLQRTNPELAQAVEAGALSPLDAYKTHIESQKPKKPLEINGRLVDPDTYGVLADFSDQPKAAQPSFETLADGTYGWSDPNTQSFNAVGQAQKPDNLSAQVEARRGAAESLGLTPDSPAYQSYILTGKMPREDAQPLTSTDKKALWAAEDEIPMLDNTLSSLDRAKELNKKTFTGVTAGARGYLGTAIPGGDLLVDGESAKATAEFNKLMSMEAIQSMAQSLKGATTDAELARFVDILADPSTDPDIRERTIDRMKQLAQNVRELKASRVNELRGGGVMPGQGQTPGQMQTKTGVSWSMEP